ncbi:uncharacterized protein KGF55_002113 [Candida pseudojiufengensis]|uniref:uncharacterized protein n=1 Tax=Candida pseudojiufengensis TaxID=497109 RepID=UPI00222492DB|nr:uncharacterized protein KGF55_002113 [Candida pseudojiufengensis]KAI5964171.1 hypothetical protein KGF55_002113 [Candida pseudojiufengensis]
MDQPVQDLIEKIPDLKKKLKNSLDFENKLFTVLTYDPVLIDPRLYLHFYYPEIDGPMKKLLLERLLFHQQYSTCWQLFLGETLIDIDEFLTSVKSIFNKQNNEFAIIYFILSQPNLDENGIHKIQILDSLTHIFKINARQVLDIYYEINDLRNIDDIMNYENNNFATDVIKLKKIISLLYYEGASKQEISQILLQFPQLLIKPGWVSSLLPKFEFYSCLLFEDIPKNLEPFMDSIKEILPVGVRLNDVDAIYLLHSNVDPFVLFSSYKLSRMQKNISNLMIESMLRTSKIEEVKAAFLTCSEKLTLPVAVGCLDLLLPVEISALSLIKPLNALIRDSVVMQLTQLSPSHYLELIPYYTHDYKVSRHLIKSYCESSIADIEDLKFLASQNSLSKRTLLEIFRSTLLRTEIIDENFIDIILNSILRKSITKVGNFSTSFESLTLLERNLFHATLRSLGQSISVLPPESLASVMDILYKVLHSTTFEFKDDDIAQKYLLKSISNEVFNFVLREENRVEILSTVMSKMETSTFWVKYNLIKGTVLDDYKNSIKLLKFYSKDKLQLAEFFPAIISGILNFENLELNKKINLLDFFFKQAKIYGFNNVIKMKNGFEIVKYFKEAAKKNELDDESVEWLIQLTKKSKYVKRVMNNVKSDIK